LEIETIGKHGKVIQKALGLRLAIIRYYR